jgi:hypothetical protein
MALDVNRWLHYAKARLDRAVGQGNRSLDRLEAEREVELADKPWLRSDAEAPTLDEARARIEWEAERQRRDAHQARTAPAATPAGSPTHPAADADAEQEGARLELERRDRESAARLAQIREELGVDPPPTDPTPPDPTP